MHHQIGQLLVAFCVLQVWVNVLIILSTISIGMEDDWSVIIVSFFKHIMKIDVYPLNLLHLFLLSLSQISICRMFVSTSVNSWKCHSLFWQYDVDATQSWSSKYNLHVTLSSTNISFSFSLLFKNLVHHFVFFCSHNVWWLVAFLLDRLRTQLRFFKLNFVTNFFFCNMIKNRFLIWSEM